MPCSFKSRKRIGLVIHERWDGRWAGSVQIGYEDGRRVRKHLMGHSRAEVKDKMASVMRAHEEKRPIPDQRQKVGPFLRHWLDEVARPTIRASTYASYDDIVTGHIIPGLGRIALAKLAPADIQTFLNHKMASGLSPRRVQYIHAVLRRALVTAEKWGMVTRNVAKLVDPPRVPKHEITPLTPEQARRLIEAAVDDRHLALYVTALGTGLRQGELLGLRWEDVELDAGRLRVRHSLANVEGELTLLEPKTDRSRRMLLPDVGGYRAPGPPHPPADGAPRGRLTLGRQRSRIHDDARHGAACGDGHAGIPGSARAGRTAALPLPRPPSCCRHVPAGTGHDARGRQEPPRAQLHHADLQHVRPCAGAAAAGGRAGDGRGAGRLRVLRGGLEEEPTSHRCRSG